MFDFCACSVTSSILFPLFPPHPTLAIDHCSLVVHDYFSDPLGWDSSVGSHRIKDFESFSVPPHVQAHSASPTVVVLDSLSPLLDHHSLSVVCRQLLKLSKEHAVMSLLHTDLHDSHVTLTLEHQCPTVVRLGAAKSGHLGVAQTRHLRKSGKVLKSVSMYVRITVLYVLYMRESLRGHALCVFSLVYCTAYTVSAHSIVFSVE